MLLLYIANQWCVILWHIYGVFWFRATQRTRILQWKVTFNPWISGHSKCFLQKSCLVAMDIFSFSHVELHWLSNAVCFWNARDALTFQKIAHRIRRSYACETIFVTWPKEEKIVTWRAILNVRAIVYACIS